MKKDINSVKDIKLNQLKEYVLSYHISCREEVLECWSLKSLLRMVSFQKDLYNQTLNALYKSRNFEEMEYHLVMMNILFHHFEYIQVKRDLLQKLLDRPVGLNEYLVIRHLVDFKEISFELLIEKLYQFKTPLLDLAKMCLIEDEYELAFQYLKKMDHCDNEVILDLLCQYSPTLYYRLKLNYHSKQKQSFLFQTIN